MPKIVSVRSTKNEILNAYEEMIKELEVSDKQSVAALPFEGKKDSTKDSTTQKPEQIINRLGDIRLHLNKNLNEIVDTLVEESEQLQQIKEKHESIRREIESMNQIKVQATTLQNLFTLKEEKEIDWQKAQKQHEKEEVEQKAQLARQHAREEEDYEYNLTIKRQKEEDEYTRKRKTIEAELIKRGQDLDEKQEEFKNLHKQVADLEKRLDTDVNKARKEVAETVTRDLQTNYNLERTEAEGELKVLKLTIDNLQKRIISQDEEIKELKQLQAKSTQQIKDIAVSVIETKKPAVNSPTSTA